jgi:uncharacterized membrane protein
MTTTIRNPVEWSIDQLRNAAHHAGSIAQSLTGRDGVDRDGGTLPVLPAVRTIGLDDIDIALRRGFEDFKAARSDVLALAAIYPIAGLVLWWVASNYNALPLLFPLISGFALVGPVAAVGLYEMSRQREQGKTVSWADAFDVVRSPAFGSILVLGLVLVAIFVAWLAAAQSLYMAYLGPDEPASLTAFLTQVFTTSAGRTMALAGIGVGFLFAVLVLTISAVSFPMLLDRNSGLNAAVVTSVRAVLANPVPMAVWGLIVAGGLVLGSLPLFVGLVVVVPVLGHATWHLYRQLVER